MSVRVMNWVFEQSRSRKGARLVLLAIADCANDEGKQAYPSQTKLQQKTGLSERAVRDLVIELEALGELVVDRNAGPHGCNLYQIVMRATPAESAAPPAVPAPRQNLPPGRKRQSTRQILPPKGAESAPGTIKEPSKNQVQNLLVGDASQTRPDVEHICDHLVSKIRDNGSRAPAITQRWRTEARLLLDKDQRTVEQIIRAIDWCQDDPFWKSNILSMPKLRAKYDQLRLAAQRSRASPNGQRGDGLIEVNGFMLKPETAARLADRERFAAMDAAEQNDQLAIGKGPAP